MVAGKSPRSRAYEEQRFPPHGQINTRRHFKKYEKVGYLGI